MIQKETNLAKLKHMSQGRTLSIQVQLRHPAKKVTPGQKKRSRQGGSEEKHTLAMPIRPRGLQAAERASLLPANLQLLRKRRIGVAQEWTDPASSFRGGLRRKERVDI